MNTNEFIDNNLQQIFDYLKIRPTVMIREYDDKDDVEVSIEGRNLSFLIGYRGESLDALQHIISLIYYREYGDWLNLFLDINGYRLKRKERIENIAKNFIDKARFLNKEVEMPPMNPEERRYIHMFVAEYPDINSESTGEGRDRRVVLYPDEK